MKRVSDMGYKEWAEVIKNNDTFAGELWDMAMDNANYWISEYLYDFPGDYAISDYGYSYIKIADDKHIDFWKWYETMTNNYCLFTVEDEDKITEYIHVADQHYTGEYDDEDAIEAEEARLKERTEDIILRRLLAEYHIDDDVLLDFVDQWTDRLADMDNCYMNDDYSIMEHVPRHVVEAHEVKIV